MFELENLEQSDSSSIRLQTADGSDIKNDQGDKITDHEREKYRLFREKYGSSWDARKDASSGYNCAGHVWASRRTSIYDEEEWKKILEEDGYRETDDPKVGDLVVYYGEKSGILHIGRIVDMRPFADGSDKVPFVLSKWDDVSGEDLHRYNNTQYHQQDWEMDVEFWTDRSFE